MRFGKTLRTSTYQPWKDKYIDYAKLKQLLRDDKADEDDSDWTEEDENRFCDELFNAQLEKVAMFQEDTVRSLRERVDTNFERLRELTPSPDEGAQPDQAAATSSTAAGKGKEKSEITVQRLKDIEKELDQIVDEVRELKKYSNLNYTGFLKIAKKHDRKRGSHYRIRPMMQVSLARRPFNSEKGYAPLLSKLSVMYEAIHQYLDDEETLPVDLGSQPETHNGERYTAYKFWIHPDNLLEVKTMILRHLPALVYSDSSAKEPDASTDPTLTSLYFDNSNFELYTNKVERTGIRSSVRLRWYGQLSNKPDIHIERKIVQDNGVSEELKFDIKEKYVKQFLDGEYRMEKTVSKMERQGETTKEVDEFKTTVDAIQSFVQDKKLDPVLRANYVRSAFQKPNDDRVRISIDTDLAFIREDTLDERRPCREPCEWHRRDIDNRNLTYPFKDLASGDISRFPFAVLEIKLKDGSNKRRAAWIEDLMASHLLHPSPLFSKFVHGVAVLFDDYVNRLPFWLSDLETDIRKDPQVAFEEEEKRRSQRATDELAVGVSSLLAKAGSFKPSKSSPIAKSYLAERAAEDAAKPTPESVRRYSQAVDDETTVAEESSQNYGATSSVLPSFSLTRYSKWKRAQSQPLPEGVEEPTEWIKNTGPLQIEPKVWLANERTFLKWQHICILLGGLAVALYTAAGENFLAEMMGIAYIVIAVFAGLWGYYMMQTRRQMIVGRSGKDFDNMFGPLVISVALMVALILNFVFAYKSAFEKWDEANKGAGFNETSALPFVDEL